MGAPDNAWGLRRSTCSAGAILRLDTAAVAARIADGHGPLDVKTDGGGTYNPFAADAPLTIYATGVRNAYDLVWHSNGRLYVPTNGSAAGGDTPALRRRHVRRHRASTAAPTARTPAPPIAGIDNVNQTENDYLFHIVAGRLLRPPQPDPRRVRPQRRQPDQPASTTRSSPSTPSARSPTATTAAPPTTSARTTRPTASSSTRPTRSTALLKGKLLVVRYSGGDDIVVLDVARRRHRHRHARAASPASPASSTRSTSSQRPGHRQPLRRRVRRAAASRSLRPIAPGAHVEVDKPTLLLQRRPRRRRSSPTQKVVIRNTGTAAARSRRRPHAQRHRTPAMFVIVTKPDAAATTIPVGGSRRDRRRVHRAAAPTSLGIKTATLADHEQRRRRSRRSTVNLRGLATAGTGGQNEPSLQRMLDLYQIPINVGDTNPANTNLFSNAEPLSSANDEVTCQRLVKAGSGAGDDRAAGDVRRRHARPCASATTAGHADREDASCSRSPRPTRRASTRPPIGTTSFDPGASPFGLYIDLARSSTTASRTARTR